jgi:ABC-type nitrate/sulfonate/bicarbonate transport system permease component
MSSTWAMMAAFGRDTYHYLRSVGVLVLLWWGEGGWLARHALLPGPLRVGRQVVRIFVSGEFLTQVSASLWRLMAGYTLAAAVGVALGVAMALIPLLDRLLDPLVQALRPISAIAWIPLVLFFVGVGDGLPIFVIFYAAVFPFQVHAVAAIHNLDESYIKAARTLGVPRWMLLTEVILPAITPVLLIGARIAMGLSWVGIIIAELVGAPEGVGFAINWYRTMLQTDRVLAWIFIVGLLGFCLDSAVRLAQRLLTPWAFQSSQGGS